MSDTDLFERQTTFSKNLIKTFRPNSFGHPRFEFDKKETPSFKGSYLCTRVTKSACDLCARRGTLCKSNINVSNFYMFIPRILVSIWLPSLQEKSLWKSSALSSIVALSNSILWPNWVACRAILELLSQTRTALLCSLSLVASTVSVWQKYAKSQSRQFTWYAVHRDYLVLKRLCLKCCICVHSSPLILNSGTKFI